MAAQQGSITARDEHQRPARKLSRSRIWEFFTHFTDDDGQDKAECRQCRRVFRVQRCTSTLMRHVRRVCKGPYGVSHLTSLSLPQPQPQPQLQPSGPGESLDREPACLEEDASWRDDPSVLEDHWRSFARSLSPQFEMPSHEAIEEMCDDIFFEEATTNDLFSTLIPPSPGSVSFGFAVDIAETIEEHEEVEESSQGAVSLSQMEESSQAKAKAAERPDQDRTRTGHGKTTMGPPSHVQGNRNEWVLDTSAGIHHTFNLRLLRNLTTHNLEEVADTLPPEEEYCLPVLGHGMVDTEHFAVPDVSYIQGESRNVISVAQLARSHALVTVFEPTRCYVIDKMSKKVVGEGHVRNGAYVLDYLLVSQEGGGGQAGGEDGEEKQEKGCSGSGGGRFEGGNGDGDGGGRQGRGGHAGGKGGGDQAGGRADGGNGGGRRGEKKEEDEEGGEEAAEGENEDDENEEKEEKDRKDEETKGGEQYITEEEHQQLSQLLIRGLFGLPQSESVATVPTGGVFVTPTERNSDFIMDSGAGHHITYFTMDQGVFKAYPGNLNITPPDIPSSIMGVGGVCLDVTGIGYLEGQNDAIDYVLCVPLSVANAVSVRQLASDYSVRVLFDAHVFSIVRLGTWEMVGYGKEKGKVYVLDHFRAGRLVTIPA